MKGLHEIFSFESVSPLSWDVDVYATHYYNFYGCYSTTGGMRARYSHSNNSELIIFTIIMIVSSLSAKWNRNIFFFIESCLLRMKSEQDFISTETHDTSDSIKVV